MCHEYFTAMFFFNTQICFNKYEGCVNYPNFHFLWIFDCFGAQGKETERGGMSKRQKGKRFICRQLQGRCLMQQWKQQKNGQHESREEGVMKLSEWLIFPVNKEHTLNEITVYLGAIFASYM